MSTSVEKMIGAPAELGELVASFVFLSGAHPLLIFRIGIGVGWIFTDGVREKEKRGGTKASSIGWRRRQTLAGRMGGASGSTWIYQTRRAGLDGGRVWTAR